MLQQLRNGFASSEAGWAAVRIACKEVQLGHESVLQCSSLTLYSTPTDQLIVSDLCVHCLMAQPRLESLGTEVLWTTGHLAFPVIDPALFLQAFGNQRRDNWAAHSRNTCPLANELCAPDEKGGYLLTAWATW